jgi:methionyl-tRNA formyltransferase
MTPLPRIVFFGTPEMAVASLQATVRAGYPVAGVVTAPDRPAGRGLKLSASPVKEAAMRLGLPLLQPPDLNDPGFCRELAAWNPEIQVVVAFRLLPRCVWALPPLGTFNLHASLLPQYRGAAPINWVLINGEKETGLTTFFLEDSLDTGNVILSEKIPVLPDETAGELRNRMMEIGAALVLKTLHAICNREASRVSQESLVHPDIVLKKAPKLKKEDCMIRWEQDVEAIHNRIRGLSPDPGAFTILKGNNGEEWYIKIFRARPERSAGMAIPPGTLQTDGISFFKIAGQNGFIHLLEVRPAGRKAMEIQDFLRGFGRQFL